MRVLLAHTLKPATENRISLKIGHALSTINGLEVKVVGADGFSISDNFYIANVDYSPLFKRKTGLISGLRNLVRFWNEIRTWRPDVVVCCTPTLLPIGLLAKWTLTVKLIFDCQENYQLNLKHQSAHRGLISYVLIFFWPWFLSISKLWVDRIWFAEGIYLTQLPFIKSKALVFENKVSQLFRAESPKRQSVTCKKLLFSGVITSESGGLVAAYFLKTWKAHFPEEEVEMLGFCPDLALQKSIEETLSPVSQLSTHRNWISSPEIMKAVEVSSAILMPYRESKANEGKVPTKFYEALYFGKPVLVQKGSGFADLAARFGAGIEVDFERPERNDFAQIATQISEYQPRSIYSKEYLFDDEGLRADFLKLSGFHSKS